MSADKVTKPRKSNGRGMYTKPVLVGLTPEQHEAVSATAAATMRSVSEWARATLVYAATDAATNAAEKTKDRKPVVLTEERILAARIHLQYARDGIGVIPYGADACNSATITDVLQDICSAIELLVGARTT